MVKYKDYYQILGVNRTATEKEIKSAYRKLARQHHPDINQNNKAAEEKFKEITEAYEVLKDPEKRRRYDLLGSNWKAGAEFRPPPDFGGFTFDLGGMGGASPFSDFFEMLFGQTFGGAGGGTTHGPGSNRALDQHVEVDLSVEELLKGTKRTFQIGRSGGKTRTIDVTIPAGLRPGSKVRVPGEGGEIPGKAKGDLYLVVKLKPHPYYSIDGDNVVTELVMSPAQAVIGGEATVTTLQGPVKVTIPPGSQAGRMLRLRGRGLPKGKDSHGDHLIRLKIVIPHNPSAEERALWEQLYKIEQQKITV